MEKDFDQILDECIDRLNRGESVEKCLHEYPHHAIELEPLLQAMTQAKSAYTFVPSVDAKRSARQRFYAAIDKRARLPFWERIKGWQPAWTATISILLIVVIALTTYRTPAAIVDIPETVAPPTGIASTVIETSSGSGNFSFMVSDEVNAIADFSSLFVTIDKVVLVKNGSSEELFEFTPDIKEFDLTLLPGAKTLEIWRGNLPEGTYTQVFAYVSKVSGVLKDTGEKLEVKLPSGKLQLSHSFDISNDTLTGFTFDITVIKTGQVKNVKYILKPQVSESGTTQTDNYTNDNGKSKP